jgi:hypothetical protein
MVMNVVMGCKAGLSSPVSWRKASWLAGLATEESVFRHRLSPCTELLQLENSLLGSI